METHLVDLLVIGEITENVKKLLEERLRMLRSKGYTGFRIHVFAEKNSSLRYIEKLREVLLNNVAASIVLYEHDVKVLKGILDNLVKGEGEALILADEERLGDDLKAMVSGYAFSFETK